MRQLTVVLSLLSLFACAEEEPVTPPAPPAPPAPVEPVAPPAPPPAPAAAAVERLNLNTAPADALSALPSMTPKMVHEFEEYRPYVSIQQFRKEIGKYTTPEQVAAWEPLVFVPVDPNNSDAETLQQIGGLTAEEAAALVGGRPFASTDAFVQALSAHLTPEEVAAAQKLLASSGN